MSEQKDKNITICDDLVDILNDYTHPRFDYALQLISDQFETKNHREQVFEQ